VRVLLIVNATASSVTARRRVVIERALRAGHDLVVEQTQRRGHAAELAHAATTDGTELVVVLAGDGTLNEAADGLRGSHVALAMLPGGSTNVYARTLGVADDVIEATGQLLDAMDERSFVRIPVGLANGRIFLFHAGFGLDAAVIRQVERRAALKRYVAHPLFLASAFDTWLRRAETRRIQMDVVFPDGVRFEGVQFVIASKTSPWTYLGHRPVVVAPHAGIESDLAITTLRGLSVNFLLRQGIRALRGGKRFAASKRVDYRPNVTSCRIESSQPFPWQVDGDYLGERTEVDIELVPDALTIVVPLTAEAPTRRRRARR